MKIVVNEYARPYARYLIVDDNGHELAQVHRDVSIEAEWAAAHSTTLEDAILFSEESMAKNVESGPQEWLESEIERLAVEIESAKASMNDAVARIRAMIESYQKELDTSTAALTKKVAGHTHSVRVGRAAGFGDEA